ncbi:MAG: hypothetical protein ABR964_14805, partial [Tepidisphaeraceae bacterium]
MKRLNREAAKGAKTNTPSRVGLRLASSEREHWRPGFIRPVSCNCLPSRHYFSGGVFDMLHAPWMAGDWNNGTTRFCRRPSISG